MKANLSSAATGSSMEAIWPCRLSRTLIDVEPEARGAHGYLVSRGEPTGSHPLAVHADAVGRFEIDDVPVPPAKLQLEVAPRHVGVVEDVVAALAPADDRTRAVDHEA